MESPVFTSPIDRVTQLRVYPKAGGSIFVAFYNWQNCGGSILTRLHTEEQKYDFVKTEGKTKSYVQFEALKL
jgi:hypothetical protein